jgi:agmatinase
MSSYYGDLPEEYRSYDKAKIVIVPVPYDGTSTWLKGADKGPAALFDASQKMQLYDIETDSEVFKCGIATDKPVLENHSPEKMVDAVQDRIKGHLEKGKFPIIIGGEHSVSIGAVQAVKEKYPDLSVLQLDAHADLRDAYKGSRYNHGCVMGRIKEICPFVQVGIRSMGKEENTLMDHTRVFYAQEICNRRDWMEKAIGKLTPKVYITIDLDVFNPALFPSTGTPEPGGLSWYEVLTFLKKVSESREIVGFDVVELCPNPHNRVPDFTAALLIYKLLSYRFNKSN